MTTPSIATDRLLLAPFARTDTADVFAYAANPNVARYTTWKPHQTIADSEAFIDMVLARGPDEHTWAIRLRGDPHVIGAIEFGLNTGTEAQIDYVLAEPFWNRGLMTEAARAVLAWGLNRYLQVRRVVSCAVTQNVGSQRVMEKCGLRFERTRLDRWEKSAVPVELRVYALVRDNSADGSPGAMSDPTDNVTNLFVHRSAAQRYAAARPFFHPLAMAKIVAFTGRPHFGKALNVACGTGQSARALAAIADEVDAIDISPDMLAEAPPAESICFQVASAERMPFPASHSNW